MLSFLRRIRAPFADKPWYLFRPRQLLVRIRHAILPPPRGFREIQTSWGAVLRADPGKSIGRALLHTGVHDLVVAETIARIVLPGDWVVDGGANIGHMAILAAVVAGREGRVMAVEPHPQLAAVLRENILSMAVLSNVGLITVHEVALSDHDGRQPLFIPDLFDTNDGVASLDARGNLSQAHIDVAVTSLDSAIGAHNVALLKLDVEGYEMNALRGAATALHTGRIRHVLLEEHHPGPSASAAYLRSMGYSVFLMQLRCTCIRLVPVPREWSAPVGTTNLLATRAPAECILRLQGPGWRVLNRRFLRQSR